jgi:GTPase SAR1 family protein
MPASSAAEQRFTSLGAHLEQENPILLSAIQSFREVDRVAQRMALLSPDDSYASQVAWWPLISVLGTFSSGKSTFLNDFLGEKLQRTGNQAVDDRFTVICYSPETKGQAIPGVALDADPRFPFYQISRDIEQVAKGEGRRIDSYLQLRTSSSERLRGKILIDSPGFDADAQRNATLRITDHIMDLSDLVLVFFDARHPEPGAMQDTLEHLVARTIKRPDADKFLYILSQIDTAAREDNPEEVIAAWQRALGEKGLTAGRFYSIYSPSAGVPITDETLRRRFETKRDADLAEIHARIDRVEVERAYRIVGTLDKTAKDIRERAVPILAEARRMWQRRTLWLDAIAFGLLFAFFLYWSIGSGHWQGLSYEPQWLLALKTVSYGPEVLAALLIALAVAAHFGMCHLSALTVRPWVRRRAAAEDLRGDLVAAFHANTGKLRSVFFGGVRGWGSRAQRRLARVREECDTYVQTLNDRFTNPSGRDAG